MASAAFSVAPAVAFEGRVVAPRSRWISGPWADALGILFCPVLALVAMESLWHFSGASDDRIYTIAFGLIVTGHHMPGWLRAWGEPAVYQRHKARLWVSVVAIPLMVLVPAALGLGVLVGAVASIFDLWHTSMQQHGLARIYSGKAGDIDKSAARVELACVLTWYATVVAWSDSWSMGIATALHNAGIRVFDAMTVGAWISIQCVMAGASVILFGIYVWQALALWRVRRVVATNKHLVHAVMFIVALYAYRAGSWYRAQSVQNIFHAFQYFFMVWIFSHLSISRQTVQPSWGYRTLFARRSGVAAFAALVCGYGLASFFVPDLFQRFGLGEPKAIELAGSVVGASLLLHFYVDSFIWKVRDKDVQKALDIGGGVVAPAAASGAAASWKGALHATAYFGLPLVLVGLIGSGRRAMSPDDSQAWTYHAAELFPGSGVALLARGRMALVAGNFAEGRAWLEHAFAVAPTLAGSALGLAELDQQEGRDQEGLIHLRAAVRAEPERAPLHVALATALGEAGSPDEAARELRVAAKLAPSRPEPHIQLGILARSQGQFEIARDELRQAEALAPQSAEAVVELALTLSRMGDRKSAFAEASAYSRLHPEHAGVAQLSRELERP